MKGAAFDRALLVLMWAVSFADAFDLLGISWLQIQDGDLRKAVCVVEMMLFWVALLILRRLDKLLEPKS